MRTIVLFAVALLSVGCGARAERAVGEEGDAAASIPSLDGGDASNVDGDVDGDGPPDARAECAPYPTCGSRLECPAADGCNRCLCTGATWSCTTEPCGDAGATACPARPVDGEACPENGQQCGVGCTPHCACLAHRWSCGPAPPCGSAPPAGNFVPPPDLR